MPLTVLLCTDGSPLAAAALAEGLAVVIPADRYVVAMVIEPIDPTLVVGTGMAGGVMSASDAERERATVVSGATRLLDETRKTLGLASADIELRSGSAGPTICDLATELSASVIVMGTRGRGGLRRAVLGSVSDFVVRNAPCPVVTTGPAAED